MKCPRCGKETPNDSQACINCGVKFRRVSKTLPSGEKTVIGPPPPDSTAQTSVSPPEQTPKPPADTGPESTAESAEDNEVQMLREKLAGRYDIIRKLGAGGMASVYLAREIALDREVAIKLLPQAFVRDGKFTERFKNEARIAAGLEHPNIVRIYQIAEEGELVYFVMSYIPGGSLTGRITKEGGLPVDDVVRWGIQITSALAYGHQKGVIHRDLKPDNIMLDRDGAAIVTDYGIARAGEGTGLTQTGAVVGTPQFMSPEQARGKGIDARSDIYAMGIMLYQMATGEPPFQASDAASLMYMHVHETPEPPDALNADVPVWLRNIILRCLAKNPDDRFANADELTQALAERMSPSVKATPVKDQRRSARFPRIPVITAAVIFALAVGGLGYWRMQQNRASETERLQREQAASEAAHEQERRELRQADDSAWEQAQGLGTMASYRAYLLVYPEGFHAEEAAGEIASLEATAQREQEPVTETPPAVSPELAAQREAERLAEQQRTEQARQDDLAFQNAEMVNTTRAYETYLNNYPDGGHVDVARERITAIDAVETAEAQQAAQAEAARDDQAFRAAQTDGTKQGYNAYLISYPEGRHADEVRTLIAAIDVAAAEAERIRVALSALSVRMVSVPAGTFMMGSEEGGDDEEPVRTVTVSAFTMSTTEVTQNLYREITGDNPSYFKLDDNNPVERVSWDDAIAFCNRLSERIGLEPCYDLGTGACDRTKNGFRLPTEAEWEYACRAGSGSDYGLGNGESALDRMGWYRRNSLEATHPVGQKSSNAWGLSDLHGNVWEWCEDWYAEDTYASGATENPGGPVNGSEKVVRGGSYLDGPDDARSAKRRSFNPDKDYSDIGFRIVR